MRSKDAPTSAARIAELRLPGLLRMIAAAENRALKLEVEKGEAAAAPARAQVERYRLELAHLEATAGGDVVHRDLNPPNMPAAENEGDAAAEEAVQRLQQERALEQARAELDQAREERDQALTDAALLRARRAPSPAADPIDDAAAALRGLSTMEMKEAVRRALPAPPRPPRGAGRTPQRPALGQLDARPMRPAAEVIHAAA